MKGSQAAFLQDLDLNKGMSYYQWLVGQLASNPRFFPHIHSIERKTSATNIIKMADNLIKKMESKE